MDLGKLADLSQHRKCVLCGAEFHGTAERPALEQFSDHMTVHNPAPEQWNLAHELIQQGKERASRKEPT